TNGIGSFSATLNTAGVQTIKGTDTANSSITGTSGNITVSAAAATHFLITMPNAVTSGTAFNFTVTAEDQFSNITTGYAGTVHFTSSDTGATLPANATLASGVGTFSGTLKTTGAQTFTATDTVSSSVTGNAATTVNAAISIGEPSRTRWSVNQPNFSSTLQI